MGEKKNPPTAQLYRTNCTRLYNNNKNQAHSIFCSYCVHTQIPQFILFSLKQKPKRTKHRDGRELKKLPSALKSTNDFSLISWMSFFLWNLSRGSCRFFGAQSKKRDEGSEENETIYVGISILRSTVAPLFSNDLGTPTLFSSSSSFTDGECAR
jgi:hypothetical protein